MKVSMSSRSIIPELPWAGQSRVPGLAWSTLGRRWPSEKFWDGDRFTCAGMWAGCRELSPSQGCSYVPVTPHIWG